MDRIRPSTRAEDLRFHRWVLRSDHQLGTVTIRYTDEIPVIMFFSESQRRCLKADRCLCNKTIVKDINGLLNHHGAMCINKSGW